MNTAEIIPIRNDEPAVSAVDRLLGERAAILAELERLNVLNGPVAVAEAAVAAVDRAIETLDADERSRTEAWARNGDGLPPEPRNSERAGLVRRRLELQSEVDSARNRANAVGPRRTALAAEITRIDHAIFGAKISAALAEARRWDAEAHRLAREMRGPLGRVVSLRFALLGLPVAQGSSESRLIGETIGELDKFRMPELGANSSGLEALISEWEAKLR